MNTAIPKESVLVKCWIFEYVDFRTVTIFLHSYTFQCWGPVAFIKKQRTLIAKKNWQQMCKSRFNTELARTGFLDQFGLLHVLFLLILIRIRSPANIYKIYPFSLHWCNFWRPIFMNSNDLLPLFLMKSPLLHKAYSITCASIKSNNNKTWTPSS